MKSRLLSSATALVLLLGFVSTNLFGQITNPASVEFMVLSYSADDVATAEGFQLSSAGKDSVGRLMDVAVRWDAPEQFLSEVTYTITLPKGTVLEEDVKDNVYVKYKDVDSDVTVKIASAKVAVDTNPLASYSASKRPVVTVADNNTWPNPGNGKTVTVSLLGGIYIGKALSDVNSETGGKMKFSLEHSATAGTVISDVTNFYAVNDLADGVQVNTKVTGYIDEAKYWSNIDSLVFVDRFGNSVPDFMTSADDSLAISVAAGAGQFADSSEVTPTAGTLEPLTTNICMYYPESDSTVVKLGGLSAAVGTLASANDIYHQDAATDPLVIYLGAPSTSGGGALGLTFDAPTGAESTTFTFTLEGTIASGTVLEVEASGVTEVTRDILPPEAAKDIGTLTLATTVTGTNYNGEALGGDFTLTLLNRFGEAFVGVVGTVCDSVLITFEYWDATYDDDTEEWSWAVNETLTGLLNSGGGVTSKYTRPATKLNGTGIRADKNVVSGGTIGDITDGVATLTTPKYLGTTSHPYGDSIKVIATAYNDPTKTDNVMIKVEPSVPVAFDLDTLKVNLVIANAQGHIVEGMPIAINMPMFALDTAYNRVSNMNLDAGNGSFYLDALSEYPLVEGINFLMDLRDPVGYQSQTIQDSILFATVGDERADGDSSYICDLTVARTDSSRLNLGGVGDDALGLSLLYAAGINFKLSIVWDPGAVPGGTLTFAERTIDLGLFNITPLAATDSVESITQVSDPDTVSATHDLKLSFLIPMDPENSIGPNLDEKLFYINLLDLPNGGVPAGIAKESIEVSTDNVNYYASLDVTQGAEDNNALVIATPIELNSILADLTVWVKILDFVNPSVADTFGVQVKTDASPVLATNLDALVVLPAPTGPQPEGPTEFTFVTMPDSLTPDTLNAQDVEILAVDADLIEKVYINIYESTLTLDEATNLFVESDPVVTVDSLVYTGTLPDTVEVAKSIPVKDLATRIAVDLIAIDAGDDTVTSAKASYLIAPKRGKRNLTLVKTNVADLMRCVYLVAGVVETPRVVDWFGLDLDQSGTFDALDLQAVLAIWRGTGTLLASASGELASEAKVELSYEAVDKANANLMVNLENNGILNMGVFRVKYDTEKYVLGDASATGRLEDLTVVSHNNEAEGEYSIVVVNVNGRPIVSGTGVILTIPVSSVGEKFDGIGEISLLSAGFEQSVQVELNSEALALKVALPKAFALSQNFPNPFNPQTTIAFDIPEGKEVNVRLNVYNMRGQLVRTLVNEFKSEGSYQIQWDGTDNYGRRVSSGVYFYRITTGEFSQTRKMVILK